MLSQSQLVELSTDIERLEDEKLGVSDTLHSKKRKKAEVDRIMQQLPFHEQVSEKLHRCKTLRQAVIKGD